MSLKSLLGGVMDGELGHPDLLRKVVDGIAKLKRHADRGVEVLPPEVEVHIAVGEGRPACGTSSCARARTACPCAATS